MNNDAFGFVKAYYAPLVAHVELCFHYNRWVPFTTFISYVVLPQPKRETPKTLMGWKLNGHLIRNAER